MKFVIDTNVLHYEMEFQKGTKCSTRKIYEESHEFLEENQFSISTASVYEFISSNWDKKDNIIFLSNFLKNKDIIQNRLALIDKETIINLQNIHECNYGENINLLKNITTRKIEIEATLLIEALLIVSICAIGSFCDKIGHELIYKEAPDIFTKLFPILEEYFQKTFKDELLNQYNLSEAETHSDNNYQENSRNKIRSLFHKNASIACKLTMEVIKMIYNQNGKNFEFMGEIKEFDPISYFTKENFTYKDPLFKGFRILHEESAENFPLYIINLIDVITSMTEKQTKLDKNDLFDSIIMMHIQEGYSIKTFDGKLNKRLHIC